VRKPPKIIVTSVGTPPLSGAEFFAQLIINYQEREQAEKRASDAEQSQKKSVQNRG
jgi:hypothetical protein